MPETRTLSHGYCTQCAAKCGVVAEVEDGQLTKIRPDQDHPNGGICVMGAAAPEIGARPDRLLYPMRRVNPKSDPVPRWERITWEEALAEIASRLEEIKAESGAESVAFSRPTTSANGSSDWFPYMMRLANRFGTPNVSTTGYLCSWARNTGSSYTYGVGLPTPDYESSRLILMWGHNPAATNPHTYKRMLEGQRRGATVVVVDPRRSETARKADLWLNPQYGTDGALIMGAIRELIITGRFDSAFVASWSNAPFLVDPATGRFLRPRPAGKSDQLFCVLDESGNMRMIDVTVPPDAWGFEPRLFGTIEIPGFGDTPAREAKTVFTLLWEEAEPWSVAAVSRHTGLSEECVSHFYELLGTARPVCYYTWNGLEQHANSLYTNRALCSLYTLTGCFDAPGGNVQFPSPAEEEVEGKAFLSGEQRRKRLGTETYPLGAPARTVPAYFLYRAILEEQPYRLRALLTFGSNMLLQNPESDRGREALCSLDLHVHIDMFETPVARCADFVLPAATAWESPGLRVGFGGGMETSCHVQYRPPAARPPGECRPDLEIIFDLACRLGYAEDFWNGSIPAAFDARVQPAGLTLAQLVARPHGVSVPSSVAYRKYAGVDEASGRVEGFRTPTRKLELYSERLLAHRGNPLPTYVPPRTSPMANPDLAEEFPLLLTSRKLKFIVHSQHRGVATLRKRYPDPFVEVHPQTAEQYELNDGEWVALVTKRAEIRVKVAISPEVAPGTVVAQAGWWEGCEALELPDYDPFSPTGANYNLLISSTDADDISGSVAVKSYHCRIRKPA